jgi:esterase FrsA
MLRRLAVTALAQTGLTNVAARRFGVEPFLPAVFVPRYAGLGGLPTERLQEELRGIRSFADEDWCEGWGALAAAQEAQAERHEQAGDAEDATQALRAALAYRAAAAFPGTTPGRLQSYHETHRIFARLLEREAHPWEALTIMTPMEPVDGVLSLPAGPGPHPLVIIINGLEGTTPETVQRLPEGARDDVALFCMEMPGTYASAAPLGPDTNRSFDAVIDELARHPDIDESAIGLIGVSFSGYWAARLAAGNPHLRCVVSDGPPLRHSFSPLSAVGKPQIIMEALRHVTGTRTPVGLALASRALAAELRPYEEIEVPLLVVNGDNDSLCDVRDSIELAAGAPNGKLKLYAGAEHCAMKRRTEATALQLDWLRGHLLADDRGAAAAARATASTAG